MSGPNPDFAPTTTTSNKGTCDVDKDFLKSLKGIFRIVEIVLSLVLIICIGVSHSNGWRGGPIGWTLFVGIFTFLVFVTTFFLWLFKVFSSIGDKFPIKFTEFIVYIVFTGFYLIAGIVTAINGNRHGGIAAASAFSFFTMALCVVEIVFHHRQWRNSDEGPAVCNHVPRGGQSSGPTTGPMPPTA